MDQSKTAVVTGAARGIGKAIALKLAQDGFRVVCADLDREECLKVAEEIKSLGLEALAIQCDVAEAASVRALFAETAEKLDRVDVLVNNAGIFPFVNFDQMSEADWDKVMNVNLKGLFLCCREALKNMPKGGRIVNISSIASLVGFSGLVHYCASKGGANGMTRALALEAAEKNITVNAVAPGAIQTPGAQMTEEAQKQTTGMIPLARIGQPEDIAGAVAFLVSSQADYITGQVLVVDGGWTLR